MSLRAPLGALLVTASIAATSSDARLELVTAGPTRVYLTDGSGAPALELRAGERRRVQLRPDRWIDMNARGWYSADLHNHRKLEDVPALLLAEDLNLAPTLVDWVWEDSQRAPAPV